MNSFNINYDKYDKELILKKYNSQRKKWMWIILVAAFLLQMLPFCIALNLNNVFMGSDWGTWLKGKTLFIGLSFTFGSLISAMIGPYVARLFGKRINMRIVYSIGVTLASIGFMFPGIISVIISTNGNIIPSLGVVVPILWISVIVTQIGTMIFSGLGINNLISKWWPAEKRGFALGIVFSGSSLGIIWIKQLLGVLADHFGNIAPSKGHPYPLDGEQYATYFIFGGVALISGLLIVLIACKKPLPNVDIIFNSKFSKKIEDTKENDISNVSPISVMNYPVYWILAIGYLLIQVGTVHSSLQGLIIANTTVPSQHIDYNEIMATGGTLFGASCIIGNVVSGYLNDKLKPSRSIFFAGMLQGLSIFFLMYSVTNYIFLYLYFILSGLSVYIYTTMPAYISGRLYGPKYSTNHMAILSIFLAIGFALINSISGIITGDSGSFGERIINPHTMFGKTVSGNFFALEMLALVSMVVGTVIVSISCSTIRRKGVVGLNEYTPTKYTQIMTFKYGVIAKFISLWIYLTKKDYRKSNSRIQRINKKVMKDKYFDIKEKYWEIILENEKNFKKINHLKLRILVNMYFYYIILDKRLDKIFYDKDYKKDLQELINDGYILEIETVNNSKYYKLNKENTTFLNESSIKLLNEFPKIEKENTRIHDVLTKLNDKFNIKVQSLRNKIEIETNKEVDKNLINEYIEKTNIKIENLIHKKEARMNKISNKDDWVKFITEFYINDHISDLEKSKDKLANKKQRTINSLKNKKEKEKEIWLTNKRQKIDGHFLLMNYINNKYQCFDNFVNYKINEKFNLLIRENNTLITKYKKSLNKLKKNKQILEENN